MKRRPYQVNPALQTWEEKNYQRLMATRINAARSTLPRAAKARPVTNKADGTTSCSPGRQSQHDKKANDAASSRPLIMSPFQEPGLTAAPQFSKRYSAEGSSNVRLQPTKCGSDHKGPSLPPIHSPSKVRLQLPHCESGNKYASPPLMNRNAQSPSTDNCNSLSLTHSNAESLVPGLKPITPDSPEPRLAYSPRALQDRPAAHASRQSASESTTSNAFQPLLGTTAHAVAHAEALAMQHNSPAWQAKSVADTKSPAALRSAAKHQLIIPARQPRGAADATSPSGRQCNSKRGLLHSLTKTHATVPAAVERTPDTKQASLKPKAKSQHTISNPPVSCRAQNARSKALPGWNSDFSIQYQDPVSIKDQERLHSRASDTHTLPPVARPHKGKGRSPTACAVDIKQQRRQYAVSVETDDVARDDGGQWLTEGCSRKGDEHMTSKVAALLHRSDFTALLPPLRSATVYSQQDATQIEPGVSCAASFLVHSSAKSPMLPSDAQASHGKPLHPLVFHSTMQHDSASLEQVINARSRKSTRLHTAALEAPSYVDGCGTLSDVMSTQPAVLQQYEKPCSSAAFSSLSTHTLQQWLKMQHQQQGQQQQQQQSDTAAASIAIKAFGQSSQLPVGQQQGGATGLTDSRMRSPSESRAWLASGQCSALQTEDALSALNSGDLAYLASAADGSLHSSSILSDGGEIQNTGQFRKDAPAVASHAACSCVPILSSAQHCEYVGMQARTQGNCDSTWAESSSDDSLKPSTTAVQPDSRFVQWAKTDTGCTVTVSTGQLLHRGMPKAQCTSTAIMPNSQLLPERTSAPLTHLQSLVNECSDAFCNMDLWLGYDSRSSADSLYHDGDWESPDDGD